MQQYLFPFFLALGFACILPARQASAAQMRWTLEPKDSPAISLQDSPANGKVLYFHVQGETQAKGSAPDRPKFDWTKTILLGESGPLSLRVGLQDPKADSLLLEKGARRGLSVHIGTVPASARLTAFVLQQRETTASPYGLGLNDAGNRIAGVRLVLVPWTGGSFPLRTAAVVIVGPKGCSAWSFASQTTLLGRFHLEGEIAGRGSSAPGPGSDLALSGKLWTAATLPFVPVAYHLCLDWKRIGARFSSPGFPGLLNNVGGAGVRGDLRWQDLALAAGAGQQRENIDNLPDVPRPETWRTFLKLTEHLKQLLPQVSLPFYLADPQWCFSHHSTWRRSTSWEAQQRSKSEEEVYGFTLQGGTAPLAWKCAWQLSTRKDLTLGESRARRFTIKAFLGPADLRFTPFFSMTRREEEGIEGASETSTGFSGLFHPHSPLRGDLTFAMRHRVSPDYRNESLRIRGEVA